MKNNKEMLKALEGILSIESVSVKGDAASPYGEGATKALGYMLELCQALGFRVKNCQNRIGYAEIGEGDTLVGILAHLDVVPAGSGWDFPPYACTRQEGKLYGRGISDDKGPAIACVYAMKDLLDSGLPLTKRIRIIFGLAEETGNWSDMEFYKATEELPHFGFTPDASFPAIHGEKGIAHFTLSLPAEGSGLVSIRGGAAFNMVADSCTAVLKDRHGHNITLEATGRSAHASTPHQGENAISKVMAQIAQSKKLAPCPAADFYNAVIGFDLHGQRAGCALEDAQSGKLTLNVGKAEMREGQVVFSLDIRYPVTKTPAEVQAGLAQAVTGYGATVALCSHQEPVYMDAQGPWITTLMEAYREVSGDTQARPEVMGGGTYARAMANIVAFGPIFPGREHTEHQKNEYMLEEDFLALRNIYRKALEKALSL